MDFAESLKKIRLEKRFSQQDLADKLGVGQSTVGMWESGRRTPKLNELNRMAGVLNTSLANLIGIKADSEARTKKTVHTGKKVLIIDDNQSICESLYYGLTPHHYNVFLAFDGRMGLEFFKRIKPDIVLLDLKMPDMEGREVLKQIRKTSKVPVVVITAHPREISEIHLADLKIEGYIEKPVGFNNVLNTLKHIVGE